MKKGLTRIKSYGIITKSSGGIAQLARAIGSYPIGRGFKSNFRYQRPGGQAAKTPPFHGGNTGSIPVRVTKIRWCGGIGRHKGLKIPRTNNPYRFKSGHQHQLLGLPCVTSAYRFRHLFRCLFSFVIF